MKIFLTSILLVICTMLKADVYTYETVGNWNEASNWDTYPGTTIDAGDEIVVSANVTINTSVTINGSLIVSAGSTMTNDWLVTVNGTMTNDGHVQNNTQFNLFAECISNGTWENSEDGTLIVTGTGDFSCYDTFTNHGGLLGYNSSKFYLAASFENNDYITFNGGFDINHDVGEELVNNGFVQFNGAVRLEGTLVNQVGKNFNINWSSAMIVTDNSKIENYGTINVDGSFELSSAFDSGSLLGHVIVDGTLIALSTIAEIL